MTVFIINKPKSVAEASAALRDAHAARQKQAARITEKLHEYWGKKPFDVTGKMADPEFHKDMTAEMNAYDLTVKEHRACTVAFESAVDIERENYGFNEPPINLPKVTL